jgi:phosphoribosylanthranilate isomerase
MFLFDTAGAGYGGTGKKFDWNLLRDVRVGKPYFLSGGIEPADAPDILHFATQTTAGKALFALDVNSKFETAPGDKDLPKIETFIKTIA